MMKLCILLCVVSIALTIACEKTAPSTNTASSSWTSATNAILPGPGELKPALDSITTDDILRHTKALSTDEFEGRGPGTKGEDLTIQYLTQQFQKLGLKPGNPDGTYVQNVPLTGFTADATGSFTAAGKKIDLKFPDDYVAVSRRLIPESKVEDSDMIFVGYGVVAPVYGWDDYKGVDVRGKTIVMLVNDPAIPDPNDPN